MASYEVVGVCAYAQDGRIVRHRRPGAVVELDPRTAAKLGAAVKRLSKPKAKAEPAPEVDELPSAMLTVTPPATHVTWIGPAPDGD